MDLNKGRILEEESKYNCCNGYVYFDGRCGDNPIYIHEKNCRFGRRESIEHQRWNNEKR